MSPALPRMTWHLCAPLSAPFTECSPGFAGVSMETRGTSALQLSWDALLWWVLHAGAPTESLPFSLSSWSIGWTLRQEFLGQRV